MALLCDLLESSYGLQQQFLQTKGFLIISYLLEKVVVITRGIWRLYTKLNKISLLLKCFLCFNTVGWVAGKASGL